MESYLIRFINKLFSLFCMKRTLFRAVSKKRANLFPVSFRHGSLVDTVKPLTQKEKKTLLDFPETDDFAVVHIDTRPKKDPYWGIIGDKKWYKKTEWYQKAMQAKQLRKKMHFLIMNGCERHIPSEIGVGVNRGEIIYYNPGDLRYGATKMWDAIKDELPDNFCNPTK